MINYVQRDGRLEINISKLHLFKIMNDSDPNFEVRLRRGSLVHLYDKENELHLEGWNGGFAYTTFRVIESERA